MTTDELFAALTAANVRLADPAFLAVREVAASKAKAFTPKPCHRCRGKGSLSCFGHVSGGVCFHCNGSGNEHNA